MPSHKFNIGDAVLFNSRVSRTAPWGVYEVVKVLPGNGNPEYRVKSANEAHQHVARESELTRAYSARSASGFLGDLKANKKR
jgi:hypothetical protein